MSASCPYCGAKLNYGIKFCVVCGRPITGQEKGKTSKMGGGMRAGIRPADVTRRLDDLMTVAKFRHSKRTTDLDKGVRLLSLNAVSIAMGILLFFCAIKVSLDGGLVKAEDKIISPFAALFHKLKMEEIPNLKQAKKPAKADDKSKTENKNKKKKRKRQNQG